MLDTRLVSFEAAISHVPVTVAGDDPFEINLYPKRQGVRDTMTLLSTDEQVNLMTACCVVVEYVHVLM